MQDVAEFAHQIRTDPAWHAFLREKSAGRPVTVARAPGRLDVMGGVADYSGALVAEATIAEAALLALSPRADRTVRVWSIGMDREAFTPQVELSLDDLSLRGAPSDYPAISARLAQDSAARWAAYILGCFSVLRAEKVAADFPYGANLLLQSRVPLGAGVSSSAAIEVASMQAINAAYRLGLDGVMLARLAQTVENRVVGAPCGIMDQMTSALGVEDSLLLLLCQPHEVRGTQRWPEGVRLFGINSAVRHSVEGQEYTRARVAAFMGRRILGVDYLANITPAVYQERFAGRLPDEISGEAFLAQYGETGDTVTRVDPSLSYPVRAAAEHAINENNHVCIFVGLAVQAGEERRKDNKTADIIDAGVMMYASHDSYTSIGLGCQETDLLVQMAKDTGPERGIYGAKITGGGSGGTVAFLTYGEGAGQTIRRIAAEYAAKTGLTPQTFEAGKSPGAVAFGHREIDL